jgi:hypothetical protein
MLHYKTEGRKTSLSIWEEVMMIVIDEQPRVQGLKLPNINPIPDGSP